MKSKRVVFALNALMIAILACTLGQAAPGEAEPTATITSPPVPAASDTPAPPTLAPAPTATGTPTVPQVRVSAATNCRTGPSVQFDLLWTLQPDQTAEVVGKNTPNNYWIIKYPNGLCWLWGQYATVSGNIASLPEYPQPATPTASLPAAPTNVKATASCVPIPATLTFAVHVTLTWADQATNEEGYHIFRNETLLATLGPNATSFEDDTKLPVAPAVFPPVPGPTVKYGIEAFNGAGTSSTKEREVGCD